MIENIREELMTNLNKELNIIIDEGRSRKIECKGFIDKLYSNIFTINIDNKIYSYSYSDILTKKIILK